MLVRWLVVVGVAVELHVAALVGPAAVCRPAPRISPGAACRAAALRRSAPPLCAASDSPAIASVGTATASVGPERLSRKIFCNRALNMDQIQAVGFDLDYTLAEYKTEFDLLAYDGAVRKLIGMGYPEELRSFEYDASRYQRGLLIDKRRGNLIKLDRHKYVKVAYHGLTKLSSTERKEIYSRSFEAQPQFTPPDFASVDTEFLLVDVCLFAQLIDLKDRSPAAVPHSYGEIYKHVRRAVDLCHCDGEPERRGLFK